MFGEKCSKCNKRASKKYEFCPHCGKSRTSKNDEGDYGFLGKNDFEDLGIKLPFGLKTMLKPLMKELNKQMIELDKEMREQQGQEIKKNTSNVNRSVKSFSISIGIPGQAPIKFNSGPVKTVKTSQSKKIILPKIQNKKLDEVKKWPRKEPETNVRRLGESVIYELTLPKVNNLEDINIAKLEEAIEIKAIGDDEVYVKTIDVDLPLKNYEFTKELLTLELGFK